MKFFKFLNKKETFRVGNKNSGFFLFNFFGPKKGLTHEVCRDMTVEFNCVVRDFVIKRNRPKWLEQGENRKSISTGLIKVSFIT